jgi:hypothetical protein
LFFSSYSAFCKKTKFIDKSKIFHRKIAFFLQFPRYANKIALTLPVCVRPFTLAPLLSSPLLSQSAPPTNPKQEFVSENAERRARGGGGSGVEN